MSELHWNGDQIARAVNTAAQRGARLSAEHLRTVAVSRTPIMTGHLQSSAKTSSDDTRAAVSYNTPYAVKQHEELGYRHKDGQAKYLESATVSEQSTIRDIIAAQIKGVL
jgi:hypothetical protein